MFKVKKEAVSTGVTSLTSLDLKWFPQGDQIERAKEISKKKSSSTFHQHWATETQKFAEMSAATIDETLIRPVHSDILLGKLTTNQAIICECHAVKGVGKDHAKFSPVSLCSYRLLPDIQSLQPVQGTLEYCTRFQKCFSPGVVDVLHRKGTQYEACIKNSRLDSMSREVLRHLEFASCVKLTRVRDHFICLLIQFFNICS